MSQPVRFAVLLVLIAFPLLEIGLLIRAGQMLGFWRLALIVLATALLGSLVIRRIGVSVLQKTFAQAETGRGSISPVFDGLLQGVAGILLILPGLISDCLGLLLLIPAVRQILIRGGIAKLFAAGSWRSEVYEERFETRHPHAGAHPPDGKGVIIEGEYERLGEDATDSRRPQPPSRRRN